MWGDVYKFVSAFGITKGLFVLFFIPAHYWIYRLYAGRLRDRQEEINRVTEENRDYRERFLQLIDARLGLGAPPKKKKKGEDE